MDLVTRRTLVALATFVLLTVTRLGWAESTDQCVEPAACNLLWAIPISTAAREPLSQICRGTDQHVQTGGTAPCTTLDERKQLRSELLSIDRERGLTWFFQVAHEALLPSRQIPPGSIPATDRWWEAFVEHDYAPLESNVERDPYASKHPLRMLFEATLFKEWAGRPQGPAEQRGPHGIDSNDFYYVTVRVQPQETVMWLPEDSALPIVVEGAPKHNDTLRFLGVRKSHRGHIAVFPPSGDEGPPLVFPVDENIPKRADTYLLDTTQGRVGIHIHLKLNADDTAVLDGNKLTASPQGELDSNGQLQPLQIVDTTVSIRPESPPHLVAGGSHHIAADAVAQDSLAYDWRTTTQDKTGILAVSVPGCEIDGLADSLVKDHVKDVLESWGVVADDPGLLGDPLKRYFDAASPAAALPGGSSELSRGPAGIAEQMAGALKDIYNQGFRNILDVRVTCSHTPAGEDIFSITATRVEMPSSRPDLVTMTRPVPHSRSEVVSGESLLNEAVTLVVARLWHKPALMIHWSKNEVAAVQSLEARVEVADDSEPVTVRTSVVRRRDDRDTCDRISDWNKLRGKPDFVPIVQDRSDDAIREPKTRQSWFDYSLDGPGYYILHASLPHQGAKDGPASGVDAYRCVHALPPSVVLAVTYFEPLTLFSLTREKTRLPETQKEWMALGFLGPPDGLGGAVGTSEKTRQGVGPSSWNDTATITSTTIAGTVPYTLTVYSLYAGLDWSERFDLSSRWTWDYRLFALMRFDITDTGGVPAALQQFQGRVGGSVLDLTAGGLLDVSLRIASELSIYLTATAYFPRATAFGMSDDVRRTLYYDPTIFTAGLGAGASYSWQP